MASNLSNSDKIAVLILIFLPLLWLWSVVAVLLTCDAAGDVAAGVEVLLVGVLLLQAVKAIRLVMATAKDQARKDVVIQLMGLNFKKKLWMENRKRELVLIPQQEICPTRY